MFDPFCGTASILVSASAMGATTVGGDIDILVLKGMMRGNRRKNGNVFTNFRHYGLPLPEIIRFDNSLRYGCATAVAGVLPPLNGPLPWLCVFPCAVCQLHPPFPDVP